MTMASILRGSLLGGFFFVGVAAATAQPKPVSPLGVPKANPIRGAHFPALSPDGSKLCFEYLGDLWTVPSSGGAATRLTLHQAYDAYPRWSPDGNWIAFSSNREGNHDIYLVPARGGDARQLTFHSADDTMLDWSPDGTQILFSSPRETRYADLYVLSIATNRVRRLTKDKTSSRYGVFTPDGRNVLYARGRQEWWRPKYRGSANTEIYSVPVVGGKSTRWTQYDSVDSFPMPAPDGKSIYFVSNRDGDANIYKLAAPDQKPERLTSLSKDPIRFPSISRNGQAITFEQDSKLWVYRSPQVSRTASGVASSTSLGAVEITAPADLLGNWKQRAVLTDGAASVSLSPDGKTLAFAARGEIWTVPAAGGDAVRMTKTGAAEYSPVWSGDGEKLAYTSDRNGNLDLYWIDVKTKTEKQITSDVADETNAHFSEDGRFLAFVRTGGSLPGLYVQPVAVGVDPKPEDAVRVGPGTGVGSYDWSPDARWLVYSRRDNTGTSDLWVVPSVGGSPINITRYPGSNSNPQWSRDGRNIVFTSSRGSASGDFRSNIYVVQLLPPPPSDDDNPGGRGANPGAADTTGDDQEPGAQRRQPMPPQGGQGAPAGLPAGSGLPFTQVPPRATNVRIEFEDIHNRARAITNTRDGITAGGLSPDARTAVFAMSSGGQTDWYAADINSGQAARISSGSPAGGRVEFAPDGGRFYYLSGTGTILQLARQAPAASPVAFTAAMEVDRHAEIAEAFNEAWRNLRTQFYDPAMHGTDWVALRAKYEPLLAETAAKEDFAMILQSMVGELNASHTGATPPAGTGPSVTTGYLGLTFDESYTGAGLRVTAVLPKGPSDQLNHKVGVGEYVLAIDGTDVTLNEPMYQALTDKAGKLVELLVNDKPVKEGARTVKVRPVAKAAIEDLDYDNWVATRRRKVEALSGGRLAYIHIKAMDQPSLQRFQREIFGDAQSKQGLVLDERFNGGGRIHDDLLGILTRKPHVYETPRDAERSTQPFQLWNRPTILLQNEYSASDAEIFPNGFRQFGLGKIVGVPTLGGVIGTVDIKLVDGTTFRVPRTGWTTLEGKNLENYGVPPDIYVEQTPEDNAADDDKQLEAAVKALLQQMDQPTKK